MANKEVKQAAVAPVIAAQPTKISFDAWWAAMAKKLPMQHRKEIVAADFKSRGLSKNETARAYNDALKMYGVKLK